MSQSNLITHFGSGEVVTIDSPIVEQPVGYIDIPGNIDTNQPRIITEGQTLDPGGKASSGTADNYPFDYNPEQEDDND
jgi:hypothetical protein